MALFNKRLLRNALHVFTFPSEEVLEAKLRTMTLWQASLKDSNLEKTKETAIQGAFLQKFFADVLDYTSQFEGAAAWQLVQHPKTDIDRTEPDGALGFYSSDSQSTHVVIELKDALTALDKKQTSRKQGYTPVEQAYLYASKFVDCRWFIVSNFKEIRLYHKNTGLSRYEKFSVLELSELAAFTQFYYLLCADNLLPQAGVSATEALLVRSNEQEKDISKQFYQDFRSLRGQLFQHVRKYNSHITEPLLLLEKTQKLLDRLIFVCFCEDTPGLLPPDLLRSTFSRAKQSFSSSETRIWDEFRGLFRAIDQGNSRVSPAINAYDGGLFEHDPVLDTLTIHDDMFAPLLTLAGYDYESDLNVNILGHIFEQSLADIETFKQNVKQDANQQRITQSVNGTQNITQDTVRDTNAPSKRKKEGIYYTPETITRYLVEQTVGLYLQEQPDSLEQLTVLDPACGSGAFLNYAHSFLQQQWHVAYEEGRVKSKDAALGGMFDYNPIENDRSIVLRNLYGVDVNRESVDITKLALWLKTARPDRPLQNLDANITWGNSLIDDPAVTSDAFDWQAAFPKVMAAGGFDVILGNPPYIFARDQGFHDAEKTYFYGHYQVATYQLNTYALFVERALRLLKPGGFLGFILPNTWLTIDTLASLRRLVLATRDVTIINSDDAIFADANVDTCLLICRKGTPTTVKLGHWREGLPDIVAEVSPDVFGDDSAIINIARFAHQPRFDLLERINAVAIPLSNVAEVKSGLKAYEVSKGNPPQTKAMKQQRVYHADTQVDASYWRYLEGKDVCRYHLQWSGQWLQYGDNLAAPRREALFRQPRILVRQIPSQPPYAINAVYTEDAYLNDINSMVVLDFEVDPYVVLAVLNSSLVTFWFIYTFDKLQRKTFPQFKVKELKKFPMPKRVAEQPELGQLARDMQTLQTQYHTDVERTLAVLQAEYTPKHLSKHLQTFFSLGWNEFIDELSKQRVKLSLKQKENLYDWFREKQQHFAELAKQQDTLNANIDRAVAMCFGLDDDALETIYAALRDLQR